VKIHVRYFAVVRERLGSEAEIIDLPDGTDVAGALAALAARHDPVAALRKVLRVAVNREVCPETTRLADGDELALIPPVAGGSGRLARVVADRAPSVDAVMAAVGGPGIGGVVSFVGHVRDHSQGRAVERLEYEAYVEMAEQVFGQLCDEIEARHPGVRLALEHRVGKLVVGDVAVAIAAGAPHRAPAFAACAELIDLLKQRAPIWKKEIGPDGASWVGLGP
jgi:molybdopterin synthase catalytic subunit